MKSKGQRQGLDGKEVLHILPGHSFLVPISIFSKLPPGSEVRSWLGVSQGDNMNSFKERSFRGRGRRVTPLSVVDWEAEQRGRDKGALRHIEGRMSE